jgi:hypothetical protein
MSNPKVMKQLKDKFPPRNIDIQRDTYSYQPGEELQLKVDKIMGKLDWNAAPGSSGLRNGHLGMWNGAFTLVFAETTMENLERLVSDMANDRLPPWFMQVMHGADFLAIVETEGNGSRKADHKSFIVPNTISKVADKAMAKKFEEICKSELMPQLVGVGLNFAAKLLAMGLRMTLHVHNTFVRIIIDLKNAYNAMRRSSMCETHIQHDRLRRIVSY